MKRILLTLKGFDGRAVRVTTRKTLGDLNKGSNIDLMGTLTLSSPPGCGLNEEEHASFLKWKQQLQSGEIKTRDYPFGGFGSNSTKE